MTPQRKENVTLKQKTQTKIHPPLRHKTTLPVAFLVPSVISMMTRDTAMYTDACCHSDWILLFNLNTQQVLLKTTLVSPSTYCKAEGFQGEEGFKVHVQETHPYKPCMQSMSFSAVTHDSLLTDYSCSMHASDEKEGDTLHGVPSPDDSRTDGHVKRYVPSSV